MLLYGPPGTGKTTFLARETLAEELGWPVIIVTPSDFILRGAEAVEARAKDIFDALQEQQEVVILFDEIDRLILDRDSLQYERQGDFFQLMTPSMLTKLQDLHNAQRSIFIISTNYADRIDAAIKRSGRIDRRYFVPPLDRGRRAKLLQELSGVSDVPDALVRKTPLATYGEIKTIAEELKVRSGGGKDQGRTVDEITDDFKPSIRISAYRKRFSKGTNGDPESAQEPHDEVLMLFGMYCDEEGKIQDELSNYERDALLKMLAIRREDPASRIDELIKDHVRGEGMSKRIRKGLTQLTSQRDG